MEQPIVVDLGKRKKKDVKALKKGQGPLVAEVNAAVEQAVAGSASDAEVIPVVLLYEKKAKKGTMRMPLSGMPVPMPMKFPAKVAKAFGLG